MLPGMMGLRLNPPPETAITMFIGGSSGMWRTQDGTNFTRSAYGAIISANGLATNGSRTVAVAGGNVVRYTDNFSSWTAVTPPSTGGTRGLNGILWTGTAFIAWGSLTDRIIRSTDGATWTERTTAQPNSNGTFDGGTLLPGGRIVIYGNDGSGATSRMSYSDDDGLTWTLVSTTSATTLHGRGVWLSGKLYIAGQISASPNGGVWSWANTTSAPVLERNFGESGTPRGIAYNGSTLILHTGSSERIWTSSDGSTWTKRTALGFNIFPNTPFLWNGAALVAGYNLTSPTRARSLFSTDFSNFSLGTIDDASADSPVGYGGLSA